MNKLISWMNKNVTPRMNKLTRNPWIQSMQESIMTVMPVIFIGSIITLITILNEIFPSFPDLSRISSFTFGLVSVFLSFLIPYNIMEKKGHDRLKKHAGMAGLAFFFMLVYPSFDEAGNIIISFDALGSGGMIATLISSYYVAAIMNLFARFSFFKKDVALPDFITQWFDTMLSIFLVIFSGWLAVFQLNINIFQVIYDIFAPVITIGQSFWGLVICYAIGCILFSFGISIWVVMPMIYAIQLQGMADNIAAVAAGHAPTAINTSEVFCGWCAIGGHGATLSLCIMMLFLAKSKRLKIMGKAAIVPSLFNINEPLIFGAPIAFNPLLMIPFWISGFAIPTLVYAAFHFGFVSIPSKTFMLWYVPPFLQSWMVNQEFMGIILAIVVFLLSWLIYYPFFKVYDHQLCKEEAEELKGEEN